MSRSSQTYTEGNEFISYQLRSDEEHNVALHSRLARQHLQACDDNNPFYKFTKNVLKSSAQAVAAGAVALGSANPVAAAAAGSAAGEGVEFIYGLEQKIAKRAERKAQDLKFRGYQRYRESWDYDKKKRFALYNISLDLSAFSPEHQSLIKKDYSMAKQSLATDRNIRILDQLERIATTKLSDMQKSQFEIASRVAQFSSKSQANHGLTQGKLASMRFELKGRLKEIKQKLDAQGRSGSEVKEILDKIESVARENMGLAIETSRQLSVTIDSLDKVERHLSNDSLRRQNAKNMQGFKDGFQFLELLGNKLQCSAIANMGTAGVQVIAISEAVSNIKWNKLNLSNLTDFASIGTAAITLVSLFFNKGPSIQEVILKQLKQISRQIQQVSNQLAAMHSDMQSSFISLGSQVAYTQQLVISSTNQINYLLNGPVLLSLSDIQSEIRQLRTTVMAGFSDSQLISLSESIKLSDNVALGVEAPSEQELSRHLRRLAIWVTDTSKGAFITGLAEVGAFGNSVVGDNVQPKGFAKALALSKGRPYVNAALLWKTARLNDWVKGPDNFAHTGILLKALSAYLQLRQFSSKYDPYGTELQAIWAEIKEMESAMLGFFNCESIGEHAGEKAAELLNRILDQQRELESQVGTYANTAQEYWDEQLDIEGEYRFVEISPEGEQYIASICNTDKIDWAWGSRCLPQRTNIKYIPDGLDKVDNVNLYPAEESYYQYLLALNQLSKNKFSENGIDVGFSLFHPMLLVAEKEMGAVFKITIYQETLRRLYLVDDIKSVEAQLGTAIFNCEATECECTLSFLKQKLKSLKEGRQGFEITFEFNGRAFNFSQPTIQEPYARSEKPVENIAIRGALFHATKINLEHIKAATRLVKQGLKRKVRDIRMRYYQSLVKQMLEVPNSSFYQLRWLLEFLSSYARISQSTVYVGASELEQINLIYKHLNEIHSDFARSRSLVDDCFHKIAYRDDLEGSEDNDDASYEAPRSSSVSIFKASPPNSAINKPTFLPLADLYQALKALQPHQQQIIRRELVRRNAVTERRRFPNGGSSSPRYQFR